LNRSNAYGEPVANGYIGKFRLVWKATYDVVQDTDDKGQFTGPKIFPSEESAEVAAWRCKRDIEEPIMFRSGPMVSQARAQAEKIFKKEAVE
jgi:hypothetical protein